MYYKNCVQMGTWHDLGPEPTITNIAHDTMQNNAFRTTLWTGDHLQTTLMSIPINGEIGLEMHDDIDQFLRIEQGHGLVQLGDGKDRIQRHERVRDGSAIFVPAGTWHNLINIGRVPLKLYSIYTPAAHPKGTIHPTKKDADAAEH